MMQRRICRAIACLSLAWTGLASAQTPAEIPVSGFVSPAFKEAYTKYMTMIAGLPKPPAMNAGRAEWDRFDDAYNQSMAGMLEEIKKEDPVTVTDTTYAGVHVGIITPKDGVAPRNRNRVLINLHGGGFFSSRGITKGQIESIPIAIHGFEVITIDYRQAPYDNYPAASEDVEAVYRALLKRYKPNAIGIFGCSSGGALAAQSIAWLEAKSLPRPGAVGLFCAAPPESAQKQGDSSIWSGAGTMLSKPPPSGPGPAYMAPAAVDDARAYPGSSDSILAGFPPTLFVSGTRSPEMSAVVVAHAHLLKLGVDSSLYMMEGGWHGAAFTAPGTPEARNAQTFIADWFDHHLAR